MATWVSNGSDVDVTQTGTINGTTVITGLSNTALLTVGWGVRGNYIQAGTTISSIDSSSQIHISLAATNSGSFSIGFVSTASYSSGTNSIQACHDHFVANGDTVTVPNGTYNWHVGVNLTSQMTLSGSGPSNVIIQNQQSTTDPGIGLHMISGTTGHSYLTGIDFVQIGSNGAPSFQVQLDRSDTSSPGNLYTIVTTNCTFDSGTVFNYGTLISANGLVFGNCTWKSQSTTGTPLCGPSLVCGKYGYTSSWNTASTLGALDTTGLNNTYFENCTFMNGATACMNADDNSRVVVRYCTITDSNISGHGQDTSQYGMRQHEVYNNTFHYTTGTSLNEGGFVSFRGGVPLVANNTFDQIPSKSTIGLNVQNINRGGSVGGCQTAYPANRQVGSGWSSGSSVTYGNPVVTQDGTGYILDPFYIWNNTGAGGQSWANFMFLAQYSPDNCGNGLCMSIPFTGTASSGSNVITAITITPQSPGFTATPTLTLGMGIYDSTGLYFAQGTYITAISGSGSAPTSVTVSNNALANHTGASLVSGYLTQGRDFIIGTARPGWSPYTYPHPLLGGSSPGSGLTADADTKITNTVVGVTTGAYPVPSNNYAALYSTQFTAQAKAGATEFTTSGYSTYARQAMGASAAGWTIAAYASGTGVVWKNTNAIIFPAVPSSGTPQPFFSLGWCDALTAGNIDFFVDSASSVTIPLGISVYLSASTGAVFTTY